MTLRRRLLILIALALPLSLLAAGLVGYFYSANLVKKELAAAVEIGETTIQEVVSTLEKTADPAQAVARLVASFDNDRDINVSLITPDGRVALESKLLPIETPPPAWLARALKGDLASSIIQLPASLASLGSIRVDPAPLAEISEVWEEMTLQFALLAGLFSVVLWIVSWVLDRALRPLDDLAAALGEVGKGNFTAQIAETGPEELSLIYREFNRMAMRLKEAELQNRALARQLNTVQDEERAELARDLHDEIGPFLFAVDVDAQTIPEYLARGATGDVTGRSGAIRQSVAHMQAHLRGILGRLRPSVFLDLGLGPAVDQVVAFWRQRRGDVEITANITRASFGARVDDVAFRIVQEALNNAIRHGNPKHIDVKLSADESGKNLHLSVIDDGGGISPKSELGFGISGMRERVAALGGTLTVSPNLTAPGVAVEATLPLDPIRRNNEAA